MPPEPPPPPEEDTEKSVFSGYTVKPPLYTDEPLSQSPDFFFLHPSKTSNEQNKPNTQNAPNSSVAAEKWALAEKAERIEIGRSEAKWTLGENRTKQRVVSVFPNELESMEEVRAQSLQYYYDSEEEPSEREIEKMKRSIAGTKELVGAV